MSGKIQMILMMKTTISQLNYTKLYVTLYLEKITGKIKNFTPNNKTFIIFFFTKSEKFYKKH